MPNEETIQKMSIVDPIQVNVNIPNFEGKPGRDGTDGRDGDDAYRIAVRNGFLGTEKEWLLTLKGQDGKSASAPTARQTLLKNNIWCEDETVDSVFTAMIGNWGKPMPRTEFKPMSFAAPVQGQQIVSVAGEPHYKVKVNGYNDVFEIDNDGNGRVQLPNPLAEDDYILEYYNFTNSKVSDVTVTGTTTSGSPDDTFEQYGIKYALYGTELHVNVVNVNADYWLSNPIFLGKWSSANITKILVKASRPTSIKIKATDVFSSVGSIPILVDHPENLSFLNSDNYSNAVNLGSTQYGTTPIYFNSSHVQWDETRHKYISNGQAVDHL